MLLTRPAAASILPREHCTIDDTTHAITCLGGTVYPIAYLTTGENNWQPLYHPQAISHLLTINYTISPSYIQQALDDDGYAPGNIIPPQPYLDEQFFQTNTEEKPIPKESIIDDESSIDVDMGDCIIAAVPYRGDTPPPDFHIGDTADSDMTKMMESLSFLIAQSEL